MAVRADGWKWIEAPRPELYHLVEDPGERENLVESHRPRARELQGLLRAAISQPATAASTVEDPEVAARLQALGYTGAGTAPRGEAPPGLPDPKDRVRLWNLLGEGEARFSARDLAGAVALYDQVLAEEPENRYALGRSGIALTEMGELSKGVARLEAAVALDPRRPELREGLARTYARLGRFEAAAEQMAELTRLQPRRPEHWSRLGSLLGQSGRPADAAAALAQAAQLAPGDPAVQIRWGFAAFGAGDTETAILALQRGAALMNTPDAPGAFPHSGALGILLARSGRPEEARPWLARCRPHEPEFAEARLELARLAAAGGDRPTARRALAEALAMRPEWRSVAAQDPALAPLLQEY
jgi:predicted Zn-dependent protease